MKHNEIMAGVEAGTITIDNYGHVTNDAKERLIEKYHQYLDDSNGANDGNWSSPKDNDEYTTEEWDERMRNFYKRILDWNYEIGEYMFDMPEMYCFHCGNAMQWVFDGDRITLRKYWNGDKHVITEERCELEVLTPMVTKIKTSGNLVFTNFFRADDCDKKDKWTPKYSLNGILGRRNIAEYKAREQNIAYGQMGNMSVGVYVNETGDSIIIGDTNHVDNQTYDMTEEEYNKLTEEDFENLSLIEGHKLVGDICLDVWRWEAGDRDSLGELLKEVENRNYADIVRVECQPGEWEVTHYFDIQGRDEEGPIYSRLVLKK